MIKKEINKLINNQTQGGVMKSYVNKLMVVVLSLCMNSFIFAGPNKAIVDKDIHLLKTQQFNPDNAEFIYLDPI